MVDGRYNMLETEKEYEKLFKDYRYLVYNIANKYRVGNTPLEDYISVGMIGLIKAKKTFDASKGYKFSTYAYKCIRNEIFQYTTKNKKHDLYEVTAEPEKDGDNRDYTLLDGLKTTEDLETDYIRKETVNTLIHYISELDHRELYILKNRMQLFGDDKLTIAEIAKDLGCSPANVQRLLTKARNTISKKVHSKETLHFTVEDPSGIKHESVANLCRFYGITQEEYLTWKYK